MDDQRTQNEIAHGKHLKEIGAACAWNWESPAGRVRFQRRVQMLTSHITPAMSVLEIGCGIGLFTVEIAKTNAQVTAIDISPDLLEIARAKINQANVHFQIENAYRLSFPAQSFDTIIGSSVLHHLEVETALTEFYRVLKPGGTVYFTEPNLLNPHIFLERKIPFLRKILHVSPDETAFILWRLRRQMVQAGFTDIQIMPFDFLYPLTPTTLIPAITKLGEFLERIPPISQIAGSLYIRTVKPRKLTQDVGERRG